MSGASHQFQLVKFRRPKHPALKRKWPIWFGEALVSCEDKRVLIVDVMHPHHLMTRLPRIGWPLCIEHSAYICSYIDWGIGNAADQAERERYTWLKTYVLNLAAGNRKERTSLRCTRRFRAGAAR